MSIRQIQYPPIAEPPAFTPPTIPQMGWWGYYPQSIQPFSDRREYRTRGGGYRAFLDTQSHAVFVPERWATPLGAMTETPDNPRQLLRRFLVAAEHPSMFGGPLQNVVATTPLLSMFEGPDDPRLGRKTGVRWPIYPLTEFGVELDDPTESWEGWYPDSLPQLRSVSALRLAAATLDLRSFSTSTPYFLSEYPDDPRLGRRTQLPTSAMFDGSDDGWVSLEQLRWAVEYPNSTRRNSLFTPEQWSYATGTSPEEWDPPALSWRPSLVERVPVLRPQTRINGLSLVLQDLNIVVPPLSWEGYGPDQTKRNSLATGFIQSVFKGEAIEQFARTLLASTTYPDITSRRSLLSANFPFLSRIDAPTLTAFIQNSLVDITAKLKQPGSPSNFFISPPEKFSRTLLASILVPDTTRRASLGVWEFPSEFKGEAPEQFARKLLASILYPDTTRRRTLPSSHIPYLSRPEVQNVDLFVPPTIVDTTKRLLLHPAYLRNILDLVRIFTFSRNIIKTSQAIEEAPRTVEMGVATPVSPNAWYLSGTLPSALVDHGVIDFRGAFWTIGGGTKQIYRSTDGITWVPVGIDTLPLPLFDAAVFSFNDKMWIAGGQQQAFPPDDTRSEVYSSEDGLVWTLEGNLPVNIAEMGYTVFDNKMWLIGGLIRSRIPPFDINTTKKVFWSDNGLVWVEAGIDALPQAITFGRAITYKDQMWLIGGNDITFAVYYQTVYKSSDGIMWVEAGTNSLPVPLDGPGVMTLDGYLWIIGGQPLFSPVSKKVYRSGDGINWQEFGSDSLPDGIAFGIAMVRNGITFLIGGYDDSNIVDTVYAINLGMLDLSGSFERSLALDNQLYSVSLDTRISWIQDGWFQTDWVQEDDI